MHYSSLIIHADNYDSYMPVHVTSRLIILVSFIIREALLIKLLCIVSLSDQKSKNHFLIIFKTNILSLKMTVYFAETDSLSKTVQFLFDFINQSKDFILFCEIKNGLTLLN